MLQVRGSDFKTNPKIGYYSGATALEFHQLPRSQAVPTYVLLPGLVNFYAHRYSQHDLPENIDFPRFWKCHGDNYGVRAAGLPQISAIFHALRAGNMTTTLVLGGARSGKSSYAQSAAEIAATAGKRLVMIATAQAYDAEMQDRIARHQVERGDMWTTIESPLELPETIVRLGPQDCAVVDCLTLWVTNLMMQDADVEAHGANLVSAVAAHSGDLWLVSNEVGWGIVPDNAMSRRFRDLCGRLHQEVARVADRVVLVAAGLPLNLK